MRVANCLGVLLLACVLNACVNKQDGGRQPSGTQTPAASSALRVALVRSDLGLGDGDMVRSADAALATLDTQGQLDYTGHGKLPVPLESEAGGDDVGMPVPQGKGPGEMTPHEAQQLIATAPPCDLLVLSSGYLLQDALSAAAAGKLQAKALLLLDEQGMGRLPDAPALPVFRIRYDIRHMAFAGGVAAGASSAVAHFGILYAADDPQGPEFVKAAVAGAKYQSNGAWTESMAVAVGADGHVTSTEFARAFEALKLQGGPNWKPNHFIVDLGRSTPTIMNALSKKPVNAYLVGAYGDYRQVRPARMLGCALKLPGPALVALFGKLDARQLATDPAAALGAVCGADGIYEAGLAEGAVGFTSFDLYDRYNPDSADIRDAVEGIIGTIKAGELGVDY